MPQREEQGDVGPIGETQDISLLQSFFIHKGFQIQGKLFQRERRFSPGRLPMPPGVQGINMIFSEKKEI